MSVFDTVTCHYPLTHRSRLNDRLFQIEFQTKDLSDEFGYWEIREDGSLWEEMYDGYPRVARVDAKNHRWVRSSFTGTIQMLGSFSNLAHEQYEFEIVFVDGALVSAVDISGSLYYT